jgi:kinesin family member C1
MESKIPKPSNFLARKPISNKPERFQFKFETKPIKLPLTKDMVNLPPPTFQNRKRGASPDLAAKTHFPIHRSKLRRSRSACDLRSMAASSMKPFKATLPTIPASKAFKLGIATMSSATVTTKSTVGTTIVNKSSSSLQTKVSETKLTAVTKTITKRIPPYDYKARFNDLTEKHKVNN